jgi:hypothetical protein
MTTRSARPLNLLVGCLLVAAMPGLAFGTVPAAGATPAPSAPAAEDPAPPAMPKPYAPPPASAPPAPNAAPAPAPSATPRPYAPPPAAPSPYPPPGAYPVAPPPQGAPPAYYYPAPPPAAYFPTAQRLVWLDLQLADLRLRHDEITFGGPVALMVTGTIVGIAGLAVIPEPCNYYDTYDTCEQRDDQAAIGVMMFIGGAVAATIGTISSIIRGAKKRNLANQIRVRESEAAALRGMHYPVQPRVGVGPTSGGGSMSLAFDF